MALLAPLAKYAVFQLERGEDKHTPHYQGYVHFLKQQRTTSCTKIFQAHWTAMYKKSTPLACRIYCTKEESREPDDPRRPAIGGTGLRVEQQSKPWY